MHRGTSQVDWGAVNENKAKIASYKERMLQQKQELGHMGNEKASSVKQNSFGSYGGQFIGQTYVG